MSREQLIEMAKNNMAHARAGTIPQTDDIYKVPVEKYFDKDRWQEEMNKVFRRMPLMLAMTAEMREIGDYKAMDVGGYPVLLSRTDSGEVKAFVNMCSHRGAQLMDEGCGNTTKFTCPYHAWTYSRSGQLAGIYSPKDFGDIDRSEYGLTELPCLEKAGLIWVTLDPKSTLDIELFLSGYDELLEHFGFENWYHFDSQRVEGPNWKIAYDGYMDLYHLPILHKNTFGADFPNQAIYYSWGPHQRVAGPSRGSEGMEAKPEEEWPTEHLIAGVWTIFPHISIAGFDGGGRAVMLSQLFPGETPDTSYTIQNYLMEKPPETEEAAKAARDQLDFLRYVVQEEDYATGIKLGKALATRAKDYVIFGRNEEGGHNFHRWVDTILETDDEDLPKLFQTG
ncbi:MAG: aromatic ring-hydroxylating dioxygenase subunit alpha [Proteobacteria bacterium]|nr:aromatic ring-hydroxylating dioxygenase subunit alpha [Pseudomonadota bacterium]